MKTRTLVLTSPWMRDNPHFGNDVTQAQKLLASNVFDQDFMQGAEIDGVYGEWTMRAAKRAQYWLGYRRSNMSGACGRFLIAFLSGEEKLPAIMAWRRRVRLSKAQTSKTIGQRAWEDAGKDIQAGLSENPPFSNRNYVTALYRLIGPWCAMWWSKCLARAGSKIPLMGKGYDGRYHYCPTILADAQAGRNGLSLVKPSRAQMGDGALMDWDHDGVADHIAMFGYWKGDDFQEFVTREGNTSYEGQSGSQSDGGAAAERTRHVSQLARTARGDLAIVRPGR